MVKMDLKYIKSLSIKKYDYLIPNEKYAIIKSFSDASGKTFEEGTVFTYLTYTFLPYDDGLQWWITTDNIDVKDIALCLKEENHLYISDNTEIYFKKIKG